MSASTSQSRPLAVVTGGTLGIGLELARIAAAEGHDLILAADRPNPEAESELRQGGSVVEFVECDLAALDGVEKLAEAIGHRPVAVLCANAGHGLGDAFLNQSWHEIRHVIDTNVTGTVYLLHRLGKRMVAAGEGRVLVTGSVAGYQPGAFQAVYNGSKAFIDNFAVGWREEIKESGVTVTLLMPGVTDTEFFERAGMEDTKVGATSSKDDPAKVARTGWDAMMRGDADVVHGLHNKLMTAAADILPASVTARQHAGMARPGSGKGGG